VTTEIGKSGERERDHANSTDLNKPISKASGLRDCGSILDGILGIVKSENGKSRVENPHDD